MSDKCRQQIIKQELKLTPKASHNNGSSVDEFVKALARKAAAQAFEVEQHKAELSKHSGERYE